VPSLLSLPGEQCVLPTVAGDTKKFAPEAETTARVIANVLLFERESTTWTVRFVVPTVLVVPEMTPVEPFKLKPVGRVPEVNDQV